MPGPRRGMMCNTERCIKRALVALRMGACSMPKRDCLALIAGTQARTCARSAHGSGLVPSGLAADRVGDSKARPACSGAQAAAARRIPQAPSHHRRGPGSIHTNAHPFTRSLAHLPSLPPPPLTRGACAHEYDARQASVGPVPPSLSLAFAVGRAWCGMAVEHLRTHTQQLLTTR